MARGDYETTRDVEVVIVSNVRPFLKSLEGGYPMDRVKRLKDNPSAPCHSFKKGNTMQNSHDEEEPYRECLLDGKKVRYDGCSSGTLEQGKQFYGDSWNYIGSGNILFLDGKKNTFEKLHHFFVRK